MSDPRFITIRDMKLLHDSCRADFMLLAHDLDLAFREGSVKRFMRPFETWRHPARQLYLLEEMKTTRARPFESAHSCGLAVDFVPWDNGRWHWPDVSDPCWTFLRTRALARGFANDIEWDRPHVESKRWTNVLEALRGL